MRAMILAAGRGERMRPLSDTLPKPLLPVGGKPLIVWHIERLVRAGITEIVINHAWLGHLIAAAVGDGSRFGAHILHVPESPALETAGGIAHALGQLGNDPFLVINGDIWCDWDPAKAGRATHTLAASDRAWLLLARNPPHHPGGDFPLDANGRVVAGGAETLTFTGIAIYRPEFFQDVDPTSPAPLAPLLRRAIRRGEVRGERHAGLWMDIGTPERLRELGRLLEAL